VVATEILRHDVVRDQVVVSIKVNRAMNADLTQQRRFGRLLDGNANAFTFQIFADDKSRTNVAPDIIHIGMDDGVLQRKHEAGGGIYVTVNATDFKGRCSDNIVRVRAVWRENDGDARPLPAEPSLVVETSPGHCHEYFLISGNWPADEQGRADFANVMERMVQDYGSDKMRRISVAF
jgi:hypothetical protein